MENIPASQMIKVTTEKGKFIARCPFFMNGIVRSLPGARWSNPRKGYVIPYSRKAAEMLSHVTMPIEFDDGAVELMAQAAKKETTIVKEGFPSWYRFKTNPMPHQMNALNHAWGMKNVAFFMGMRTGKTKVNIDFACALKMAGLVDHILVIPPMSVKHEWKKQIGAHAPIEITVGNFDLSTQAGKRAQKKFEETPADFKCMIVAQESLAAGGAIDYVIDYMRSHGKIIVIIDESHGIKNHRAARTERIVDLGRIAEYKTVNTGTPTTKNIVDLYSQFYFLDPDIIGYSDFYSFRNRYVIMGGYENKQIIGFQNVEELMTAIKPHVFQVTTEEAAPNLPPKQRIERHVQLPASTRATYNLITKHKLINYKGEDLILRSSLERLLRQSMLVNGVMTVGSEGVYKHYWDNSAKINELEAVLEEYTAPAIIWCTLDMEIDAVCERLAKLGKKYTMIDGRVPVEDRPKKEHEFQTGVVDYMVAKAGVGGVGLCFDRAELMIYMSNSFKYVDRKQSEERATNVHTGKGGVMIIDIIAEDTVDDKIIIPAQEAKEDVSQYVKRHMANTQWGNSDPF